MGLRIAYNLPNGIVEFAIAAPKAALLPLIGERGQDGRVTLSDEAYRSHVYARMIPKDAVNVHEPPDDWTAPDIDRAYRDAWVTDGKDITVDMVRAREIHKGLLRQLRAPLLAAADVEMSKAYKDQARQDAIETVRQQLRDVTADPSINAASAIGELRKSIPAILSPTQSAR